MNLENLKIGVAGIENEIIIGQTSPMLVNGKPHPFLEEWTAVSAIKTDEAMLAVANYLYARCLREGLSKISFNYGRGLVLDFSIPNEEFNAEKN